MPGSSPAIITTPEPMVWVVEDTSGSASTFIPTCFTITTLRCPHTDEPKAISRATFSLIDHSEFIFSLTASIKSVIGKPGTPVTDLTLLSISAKTMASMPFIQPPIRNSAKTREAPQVPL